jgi:hypothetical protein
MALVLSDSFPRTSKCDEGTKPLARKDGPVQGWNDIASPGARPPAAVSNNADPQHKETTMFENLEKRQLMSANLSGSEPGLLIVFGTPSSDTIRIDRQVANAVRVVDNGTVRTFESSDVTKIWVVAGDGNDTITLSNDIGLPATLQGDAGNDKLTSAGGKDWLFGNAGDDMLSAGSNDDILYGGDGNDVLKGGSGADQLYGEAGRDRLYAGAGSGADRLEGGDNNDVLVSIGGSHNATVKGNDGTDVFWVDAESSEIVTSGSAETVHRVSGFVDLRIKHASGPDTVQQVSRELTGQNLLDPTIDSDATYTNFSSNPLFPSNGPVMDDVSQKKSDAHDCYLMSSMLAVTELNRHLVDRNIVDLGDGTYAVRYQGLFGPEYIRVDGQLPTDDDGTMHAANLGTENSIWMAILEKTWAFRRRNEGTYDSIDNHGSADQVMNALGWGGARQTFLPSAYNNAQALFDRLAADISDGKAFVVSTNDTTPFAGLRANHVLMADRIEVGADGVRRLVIQDPRRDKGPAKDGILKLSADDVWANLDLFTSFSF